jgi:hypothetical protein
MVTYVFDDEMYCPEFITQLINNGYTVRVYKQKPVTVEMNEEGEEKTLSEYPVIVEVGSR